jgi:hypothetical protein
VRFDRMRAEGGWIVSAERRGGTTRTVRVESTVAGTLRLHDPFGGSPVRWTGATVRRIGDEYRVTLPKGAVLVGRVE